MFWKKQNIDVEFPEDDDHRNAYRIKPDPSRPIILSIGGDSFPVANISGTGCCFRSFVYPEGYQAAGTLRMPSEDIIFPVRIHIVTKQKDLCRCEFVNISPKSADAIHSYVLEAQKTLIRKK